jgi:Effector-associated domain 1
VAAEFRDSTRDELIDELARVMCDAEDAKLVVRRAGFPPGRTPRFDTAEVFWARVIESAENGKATGGVQAIVEEAANRYPANPVFMGYRERGGEHGVDRVDQTTKPSAPPIDDDRQLQWVHFVRQSVKLAIIGALLVAGIAIVLSVLPGPDPICVIETDRQDVTKIIIYDANTGVEIQRLDGGQRQTFQCVRKQTDVTVEVYLDDGAIVRSPQSLGPGENSIYVPLRYNATTGEGVTVTRVNETGTTGDGGTPLCQGSCSVSSAA